MLHHACNVSLCYKFLNLRACLERTWLASVEAFFCVRSISLSSALLTWEMDGARWVEIRAVVFVRRGMQDSRDKDGRFGWILGIYALQKWHQTFRDD